jgi:hypothetical protein
MHTTTISLTVTPTSGGNVLSNGVPVTGLSAAKNAQLAYTMVVPAGASNLVFTISGGTGDADMYVKFGSAPTTSSYDCRPYVSGNSETCTIAAPANALLATNDRGTTGLATGTSYSAALVSGAA